MNFMRDYFKPQPNSKVVPAYQVRPTDIILWEDGSETAIKKAGFGDPFELNFQWLDGRTAAPWVFTFEDGTTSVTHPQKPVRIKDIAIAPAS